MQCTRRPDWRAETWDARLSGDDGLSQIASTDANLSLGEFKALATAACLDESDRETKLAHRWLNSMFVPGCEQNAAWKMRLLMAAALALVALPAISYLLEDARTYAWAWPVRRRSEERASVSYRVRPIEPRSL